MRFGFARSAATGMWCRPRCRPRWAPRTRPRRGLARHRVRGVRADRQRPPHSRRWRRRWRWLRCSGSERDCVVFTEPLPPSTMRPSSFPSPDRRSPLLVGRGKARPAPFALAPLLAGAEAWRHGPGSAAGRTSVFVRVVVAALETGPRRRGTGREPVDASRRTVGRCTSPTRRWQPEERGVSAAR